MVSPSETIIVASNWMYFFLNHWEVAKFFHQIMRKTFYLPLF